MYENYEGVHMGGKLKEANSKKTERGNQIHILLAIPLYPAVYYSQ